ncbi:uncharacterized protein LOC115085610 isoform X1 [Rhinatrema bivittatum]|uniref:uncharacterized protein LOC115085610 isoform X1 n=1 Tax=Rhinatrema bivittatum TaxID=194408 RepID=UPI001126E670|nr:uncharacterized protein LOC115085610 isoform X1 [Rhinatrema bivittatum]
MDCMQACCESTNCYEVLKRDVKKVEKDMKSNMEVLENVQRAFKNSPNQCCCVLSCVNCTKNTNSEGDVCECTGLNMCRSGFRQRQHRRLPRAPNFEGAKKPGQRGSASGSRRSLHQQSTSKGHCHATLGLRRGVERRKICHSMETSKTTGKKVLAALDMEGFQADEITVKLKERNIVVSAKHKNSQERNGRKQYRSYNILSLPPDVDEETILCCLEDNTLKIKVSRDSRMETERCLAISRKC